MPLAAPDTPCSAPATATSRAPRTTFRVAPRRLESCRFLTARSQLGRDVIHLTRYDPELLLNLTNLLPALLHVLLGPDDPHRDLRELGVDITERRFALFRRPP